MSTSNKALFDRLCDLGLLSTMKNGPLFLGECNECQAQFIHPNISATNISEALIVGISISVDGREFSENTALIDSGSRTPIWFERGIQTPEESDPNNIKNIANEILEKHLEQILLLIKDGDLEKHNLSQIASEYGDKVVASYVDLDEIDRNWRLQDFNFHLRFSCADMLMGIEGSLDSPAAVSLRELRWGADDFAESTYFDEICSDLEMDPERIGSINTVYFEIEIGNVTLRADAKERLASTTAGDVELATEIREPMWSAGSFEGFVRETWSLLGPAGVSDTAPGVSPASRPCGLRGPPSAWFL